MSGAHVIAIVLTTICLGFLIALLRRGHLRAKYVMLWLPVGFGMLIFAAIPGLIDKVALAIGIGYPPALLFMLAITLLLLTCMHFSWELSRIEERLRIIAESIAMRDVEIDEIEQKLLDGHK